MSVLKHTSKSINGYRTYCLLIFTIASMSFERAATPASEVNAVRIEVTAVLNVAPYQSASRIA